MPGGRPTKYKKIYCKRAKEHLAQGYSIKSLSGLFNVAYSTIQLWQKANEEFSVSIDIGRSLGEQFYIDRAIKLIKGDKGSSDMLKFMMKNLYKNYKDNPDTDQEVQAININFNKLNE